MSDSRRLTGDQLFRLLLLAIMGLTFVGLAVADAQPMAGAGFDVGSYEQSVSAWGGYLGDHGNDDWRVLVEALVGDGRKETQGDRGLADEGVSGRLSLGLVRCWSGWCAGPTAAWAGFRSEWDDGLVWKRDSWFYGATFGYRWEDAGRLWLRVLETTARLEGVAFWSEHYGVSAALAYYDDQDVDGAVRVLLLRRW